MEILPGEAALDGDVGGQGICRAGPSAMRVPRDRCLIWVPYVQGDRVKQRGSYSGTHHPHRHLHRPADEAIFTFFMHGAPQQSLMPCQR